jgi:hypothetical protein
MVEERARVIFALAGDNKVVVFSWIEYCPGSAMAHVTGQSCVRRRSTSERAHNVNPPPIPNRFHLNNVVQRWL